MGLPDLTPGGKSFETEKSIASRALIAGNLSFGLAGDSRVSAVNENEICRTVGEIQK